MRCVKQQITCNICVLTNQIGVHNFEGGVIYTINVLIH